MSSAAALSLDSTVEAPDVILQSVVWQSSAFQERVARWTQSWQGAQSGSFLLYLERMKRYSSIVAEELRRRGLPLSLAALPIVESGYIPDISNPSGAAGLWQIMPGTAAHLGLDVTSTLDERRDPRASTLAALDYLEDLHAQFGSWFLAIAAYNAGPGTVGNLVSRSGGRRESESGDELFLRIQGSFSGETGDLVHRFAAAATLAADIEGMGIAAEPWTFDEVEFSDAISFDVIARVAGVTPAEIAEFNPQFLRGYTPGGEPRVLRLPAGSGPRFLEGYAAIPPSERLVVVEHVVASGETLSHIARRYGVSLTELMEMNSRVDPRRLQIGARLRVPSGR